MKRLFRKLISILLTLVLLVLSVAPAGLAVSAGTTDFGNAHIDCDPIIKYNEETGVYSLDLELNAELYDHLVNSEDNDIADRGYFSANYPGWYLVELWGGRGADILNGEEVASSGGAAGYVHAKVYLEKDDVLFYSLGGNGQETYTTGTGGGTNGGGDGGTMITYGVGGGGGYSALFLFDDPDYFESTYLNAKNEFVYDHINEDDRTTKYIMIAGGGGGAGAAPDGSRFSPDGGAGGSVLSSTVIDTVEGIGATVAGTYYSGDDGKSSGTSYDYIGHGGTNVPGEKASTSWNWVSGELPNDWVGAYNNQISPGAGGAGNLRGGAGGGGYCGGSGGIQQSIIVPNHVGGGGGGSSFVASGSNISTSLTEDEKSLLDINASKLDLSSGAVSITYLAGDGGSYSFTPLSNLTVSFAITDYFNISNFDYTQHGVDGAGEPTYENVTVSPDGDNTVFTIKNISLLPTETNLTGKVHITLDLTPKTNFLGGNDVPVLVDNSISVSGTVDEVETTKVITLDADNCHVNVPLNFSVLARDHIANGSIDLTVADMYIDRYADIRANVASNKFIDSITDYSVTGGTPALPAKVTESTEYTVSFTVTPANNTLINPVEGAGPECVTTTFTDTATVTILALHESHLNGQLINFVKALEYNNDGTYTFSLQTTAKNNRESHTPNPETAYGAGSLTFTVPHDGVYLVQAWGGTGGNGQSFKNLMGNTIKGGTGGAGGYVYVYLPLEAGDRIYTEKIGVAGVEGVQSSGTGGTGGTYSLVKLDRADSDTDELLAISGGGGGGGNAAVGKAIGLIGIEGESADGSTVIYSEPVTTGDPPEINYDAYNGHAGDPSTGSGWNIGSYEAGGKGADGVSYYNPVGKRTFGEYSFEHVTQSEFDAAVANSKPAVPAEMTNVSAGDGVVRVSCLELSDHDHVTSLLSGYTLNLQFSEYFDIIEEPSTGEPSTVVYFTGKNNCETIQGTDKETLTYTNATLSGSNLLTISNIVPHQDGSSSDGHFESSIDFTISVNLRPKTGFLGGNDVPVLEYAPSGDMRYGAAITQTGTTEPINYNYAADYANVALSPDVTAGTLEGKNLSYGVGEEGQYTRAMLYTWTKGWEDPDDWTADFLEYKDVLAVDGTTTDVGPGPFHIPDTNILYNVEVGVVSPGPEKATVGPVVTGVTASAFANVFVTPRVTLNLTGLNSDVTPDSEGDITLNTAQDMVITLSPQKGYSLPAGVSLTYKKTGNDVIFSYDSSTGRVVIPSSSMTDSMTLTAAGSKILYRLGYAYQLPGSTETNIHTQTYFYGETVSAWDYTPPDVPGYTFGWHWYTIAEDGVAQGTSLDGKPMPARELWVVGTYVPNTYTIKINYEWADGITGKVDPPAPAEILTCDFGETYSVTSPAVTNYTPDIPIVNGTVDEALISQAVDGEITLTVVYSALTGKLVIHYVTEDTGEVHTEEISGLPSGESYSVATPGKVGYTPDVAVVTGTMPNDGAGKEVTVTYKPNTYDVKLVIANDTPPHTVVSQRTVYYNSIYGYTMEEGNKTFVALPTQVNKTGSKFTGWYMMVGGNKIYVTNETPFSLDHLEDGQVTIYAEFDTESYMVTVEHIYLDDSTAAPTVNTLVEYGDSHTCEAVDIPGYSSYILSQSGATGAVLIRGQYLKPADQIVIDSMPAQPVDRAFIYVGDLCPLTINYIYLDVEGDEQSRTTYTNRGYDADADPETFTTRFGDSYSKASPAAPDGYTCSMPVVSGTLNDLSDLQIVDEEVKGRVVDVFYYAQAPEFSVDISWGAMTYTYDRGIWNPATHHYSGGTFSPSDENTNRITVTNNSTVGVNAAFSYQSVSPYESIGGYFTASGSSSATALSSIDMAKKASGGAGTVQNIWLWLTGSLSDSVSGTITGGRFTVTITGGG